MSKEFQEKVDLFEGNSTQYNFPPIPKELKEGKTIGVGAFGSVYEVTCNAQVYAMKKKYRYMASSLKLA